MTLNISLSAGLEKRLQEEVATGMYATTSEVVREALRHFFSPQEEPVWIASEMQRRVEKAISGQGETRDADVYFDALEQRLQAIKK